MKTVLSIAGSDSSGGAGIQADIKTLTMNGVYAMTAVTSLTAQNTTGVFGIFDASPEFLRQEIHAVFEDIYPDAVKIGMVSSPELIKVIADSLKYYKAKNIVADPVMVSTSGKALISEEGITALREKLLPIADIITPNIPESEILADMTIKTKENMEKAAAKMSREFDTAVLLKGGHLTGDADDLLFSEGKITWLRGKRIDNENTHGTGCTLSSAIAANLAKGYDIEDALIKAKEYVTDALSAGLDLGKGKGPMNHGFDLNGKYAK